MALHAVDLSVATPIFNRLAELYPRIPEDIRPSWGQTMQNGFDGDVQTMLASAHGQPLGGGVLPSLQHLDVYRAMGNKAAWVVEQVDPAWMDGYLRQITPEAQRLVKSMVSREDAERRGRR